MAILHGFYCISLPDATSSQEGISQQSLMMNDPEQVKVAVQALQVSCQILLVFSSFILKWLCLDHSLEGMYTLPLVTERVC